MNELLLLEPRPSEVEVLQHHLEGLLRKEGFSEDLVRDLSLVAEEVLVNILDHGGASRDPLARPIQVRVALDPPDRVSLEFRDDTAAFDPLQVQERDPGDERPGGWGIPLLRALSDSVEYSREEGQNVLRLVRGERDSG